MSTFSAPLRKLLACAILLAGLPATASAVQLSFSTVYYPGSTLTLVKGVNDDGELVGEYWTPITGSSAHETNAFYNYGSTYQNVDRNNSNLNEAWGINNAGIITAGGKNNVNHYNGYYTAPPYSSFTAVDFTGSSFSELFDINNSNIMVGGYSDGSTYHAFMYDLGTQAIIQPIVVPGAVNTTAIGINNSNQVVGTYRDSSNVFHGYLFDGAGYTTIDFPAATLTEALGINDLGQIVGYYIDASAMTHGYLYDVFSQAFTTIEIPAVGAYDTRVFGINNNGLLVGGYRDASGFHYGFTATIIPLPSALLLFSSGLAGLLGSVRVRNRGRRAAA